jgi:hypothetical protein
VLRDTNPTATARYYELLRQKSGAERLAMVATLTHAVRELARAGIHQDDPTLTERQIQAKLAERMYGPAVAARLFGDESGG